MITTAITPTHAAIAGHASPPAAAVARRLVANAPQISGSQSARRRSIGRVTAASRIARAARSTPDRPGRSASSPAYLAASRTRIGNESTTTSGPITTNARPAGSRDLPRTSPAPISIIHASVQAPRVAGHTPLAVEIAEPTAAADASNPTAMAWSRESGRARTAATMTTRRPAPAHTHARCSRLKPASSTPRTAVHAIPAAQSQIRLTVEIAARATTAEHSPAARTSSALAPPRSHGPTARTPTHPAETTSHREANRSIPIGR